MKARSVVNAANESKIGKIRAQDPINEDKIANDYPPKTRSLRFHIKGFTSEMFELHSYENVQYVHKNWIQIGILNHISN